MNRTQSVGEYTLGLAGLGLLRLRESESFLGDDIMAELRDLIAKVDQPPLSRNLRMPVEGVQSGYAAWSQTYDRPGNPLIAHEEPVVHALLDDMQSDPVLDAACGTGRHLAYLAARGRSVIGVDTSPDMLELARAKVPTADVRLGDLAALPVADGEVEGLCVRWRCATSPISTRFSQSSAASSVRAGRPSCPHCIRS